MIDLNSKTKSGKFIQFKDDDGNEIELLEPRGQGPRGSIGGPGPAGETGGSENQLDRGGIHETEGALGIQGLLHLHLGTLTGLYCLPHAHEASI